MQHGATRGRGGIAREGVPFYAHGWGFWLAAVWFGLAWISILAGAPETRPGVLEACTGIALAALVGWPESRLMILYTKEVALETRRRPWLKWAAFLWHAPYSLRMAGSGFLASVLMLGVGVVAGGAVLRLVWRVAPDLAMPWARFVAHKGAELPSRSFESMLVTYLPVAVVLTMWLVHRWYEGLPSEEQADGSDPSSWAGW